jgi:hypothetical protein
MGAPTILPGHAIMANVMVVASFELPLSTALEWKKEME